MPPTSAGLRKLPPEVRALGRTQFGTRVQSATKAAPDIAIDSNGVAYAVWGQQRQLWPLSDSQTVVVSVDGTGTAADIKAYVLPTP